MNRYIVKNCPVFDAGKPNKCGAYTRGICHTKPDCLIKQVIATCKKYGVTYLGDEILRLFEIRDCEND